MPAEQLAGLLPDRCQAARLQIPGTNGGPSTPVASASESCLAPAVDQQSRSDPPAPPGLGRDAVGRTDRELPQDSGDSKAMVRTRRAETMVEGVAQRPEKFLRNCFCSARSV
jgi:hypothetical protein